jgi:predicted amidohydrolase
MRLSVVALALVSVLYLHAARSCGGDEATPSAPTSALAPSAAKPARTIRVAAVQMRSTRNLDENISKTKQHLERCARDGARVVVFPECSLSGYFDRDTMQALSPERLAGALQQVAQACREHAVYAVIGMPHRDGNKLYNSAVVIDPQGNVIERYHKIQLAESWPDGGDHLSVFKVDGIPCSIIICHDERYPELVRLPVLAGARLVFYLSHESGVDQPTKIDPYRAQIQARAVENTVYVVQANAPANPDASGSHGQSRVIAPDGNIVHEASMYGEEAVIATLDLERASGKMARQSIDRGPLGAWWQEAVKRVRIVD